MTELERLALMGDRQKQEECTRRGIVLPCPFCGGSKGGINGTILLWESAGLYAHKRTGKCVLDGAIIYNLSDWNTRLAPPIGRCEECEFRDTFDCPTSKTGYTEKTMKYCSWFEPEGGEEK